MLRDPHHDLNLIAFRDFVASKPQTRTFDYLNRCKCACGQFAKHIGLYDEWMMQILWDIETPTLWVKLNDLACQCVVDSTVFSSTRVRWRELLAAIDTAIAAELAMAAFAGGESEWECSDAGHSQ